MEVVLVLLYYYRLPLSAADDSRPIDALNFIFISLVAQSNAFTGAVHKAICAPRLFDCSI